MTEMDPRKNDPESVFFRIFRPLIRQKLGTRSSQDETPDRKLLSWFRNTIFSRNYYNIRDYKNEPWATFNQEIKLQNIKTQFFVRKPEKKPKMIDPLADLYDIVSAPPPKKQKKSKSTDKKKSKLLQKVAKIVKKALLWMKNVKKPKKLQMMIPNQFRCLLFSAIPNFFKTFLKKLAKKL